MSYSVKPGSILGRIGSEIGKGLSDQIPKEVERNRLAQGLEQLSQQQGLTPFQQLGRLATLPGVTPQLIQSGAELLKNQSQRQAYTNRSGQRQPMERTDSREAINNVPFAATQGKAPSPRNAQVEPKEELGQPQVQQENPLAPEFTTRPAWTPERFNQEVGDLLEFDKNLTVNEARQIAKENEARELSQPITAQTEYERLQGKKQEIRDELYRQLQTKLHKTKEGTFKDITGEDQIQLERNVEKDLRNNPKMTVADAVHKWTNKASDYAKMKDQLRGFAGSNLFATPLIINKGEALNKLKSYQKAFEEFGNLDEFYNLLQSDMALSPQASAQIAYPPTEKISSYIQTIKPRNQISPKDSTQRSIGYAEKILDIGLTNRDSLLSIMRSIQERDAFFDQNAFLDVFKNNRDALPASKRFDREFQKGAQFLPNWADILILPTFRKIK